MFRTSPRATQLNLAKCLGNLLLFFTDTQNTITATMLSNRTETKMTVRLGNTFLVAGLLRGLGVQGLESMRVLEQLDEQSGHKKETMEEK